MRKKLAKHYLRLARKLRIHNWHRHPMFIPVVVILGVFFVGLMTLVFSNGQPVLASDSHTVVFSHDDKRETVPTRAATIDDFLQRVGVTLNEGDVVEPSKDTVIDESNFHINIYRGRPVVIVDGSKKTFAFSAGTTARSIARQAGVQVYAEDILTSQMTTDFLTNGAIGKQVVIDRATLTDLNIYGTQLTVRTHAKTVGQLLAEKQVLLAADDSVAPAVDTPLTAASQIFVTRNGTQIVTTEEAIPMQLQTVEDSSLSFGTTAIRQKGSDGKKLVTYQINTVNGQESGRTVIQTVIAEDQVTQIVARGSAVYVPADHESIMAAAGVAKSDYAYVNYIIGHENAMWCPTRWQGQNFCPAYYQEKFPGAESNTSTGYGLCQSTPASKMASAGGDWRTSAVTQLRWCSGYAQARYGSWGAAYNHWIAHNNW